MTTISLALDDALAGKLHEIATQQKLSDEELLRQVIKQYLQISTKPSMQFADLLGVWRDAKFSDEDINTSLWHLDLNSLS